MVEEEDEKPATDRDSNISNLYCEAIYLSMLCPGTMTIDDKMY